MNLDQQKYPQSFFGRIVAKTKDSSTQEIHTLDNTHLFLLQEMTLWSPLSDDLGGKRFGWET